jgi:hypothetical protein
LITFVSDKEYKGHIKNEIVYTHLKVYSLIELIKEKLDIASYKISIYREANKSKANYLEENRTLEEYGYIGASYNDTLKSIDKVTLFFDYRILENDDPILNSDFYFHNYKKANKN